MTTQRSKRTIKAPKKYLEAEGTSAALLVNSGKRLLSDQNL